MVESFAATPSNINFIIFYDYILPRPVLYHLTLGCEQHFLLPQ